MVTLTEKKTIKKNETFGVVDEPAAAQGRGSGSGRLRSVSDETFDVADEPGARPPRGRQRRKVLSHGHGQRLRHRAAAGRRRRTAAGEK